MVLLKKISHYVYRVTVHTTTMTTYDEEASCEAEIDKLNK
jgi:hypothetical protein